MLLLGSLQDQTFQDLQKWISFGGTLGLTQRWFRKEFSWKNLSVVPKLTTWWKHQLIAFTSLVDGEREGVRLRHINCCILFYFLFFIIIINRRERKGKKVNFPIHRFGYSCQNSLDTSLSLTSPIQPNNKGCQFYLQNRTSLCPLPTTSAANNLVQDAITSHLNFCNRLQTWLFAASTIVLFCVVPPGIVTDLVET